jgi:hypothetical protein
MLTNPVHFDWNLFLIVIDEVIVVKMFNIKPIFFLQGFMLLRWGRTSQNFWIRNKLFSFWLFFHCCIIPCFLCLSSLFSCLLFPSFSSFSFYSFLLLFILFLLLVFLVNLFYL